jgi:hypothetical protein
MALMREVEKPFAIYQRAVRKAAQTLTDSPENDAAQARGNAALLVIEQAVRHWVAAHPAEEICGDRFDDEVCDRDSGHDGDHCANATVGWAR